MNHEPKEQSLEDKTEIKPQSPELATAFAELKFEFELDQELLKAIGQLETETDPDRLRDLWGVYAQLFIELDESLGNTDAAKKVHLIRMFQKALIFHRRGNASRYIEELDHTQVNVQDAQFDTGAFSKILADELDRQMAQLEPFTAEWLILQLRRKINEADRLGLWEEWADEQDYSGLVESARKYLIKEYEYHQQNPDVESPMDLEIIIDELGLVP